MLPLDLAIWHKNNKNFAYLSDFWSDVRNWRHYVWSMSEEYKSKKHKPRGTSTLRGRKGGLDLSSSLRAKFGQHHQIMGKIWEVLVLQKTKIGTESREYNAHENSQRSTTRILGSYLKFKGQNLEYLSRIFLEAKFGALKFGAKPARPLNVEVPYPSGAQAYNESKNFAFLMPTSQ